MVTNLAIFGFELAHIAPSSQASGAQYHITLLESSILTPGGSLSVNLGNYLVSDA